VYILALIPLIGVTLLLVSKGICSVVRAQTIMVQRESEFVTTHAWLDILRRDARRSTSASIKSGEQAEGCLLTLQTTKGTITYTVADAKLTRRPDRGGTTCWPTWSLAVAFDLHPAPVGQVLDVSIEWPLKQIDAERPDHSLRTSMAIGKEYGS